MSDDGLSNYVEKLDGVSEALRPFYRPVDEKDESAGYELKVNAGDKSRVSEFRNSWRKVSKEKQDLETQLNEFKSKYGEVDLELYQAGQQALNSLKSDDEKNTLLKGGMDELLGQKLSSQKKEMEKNYTAQIRAKESAYTDLEGRYNDLRSSHAKTLVETSVAKAISSAKVKVRPGAMRHVLSSVHDIFSYDNKNDRMIAMRDGHERFGPKGEPYGYNDAVNDLVKDAPYLFESSNGGSASGGKGDPAGNVIKGGSKEFNNHIEDIAKGNKRFIRSV